MRRILLLTVFLMAIPSSSDCRFKFSNQSDCPTVSVTCPDSDSTKPVKFKAKSSGREIARVAFVQLEHYQGNDQEWGTIKNGQGTSTIELDLNGQDCDGLTATVEVGGLDADCPKVASCTVFIR